MNARKGSMTSASVWGEAYRNLIAGVGGSRVLLIVVIVLTACGVLAPQLALLQADSRAVAYQRSGAATLIVKAEGRIDGVRCEAFGQLENVTAAGAVREREGLTLALLASTTVRNFESTPQFAGVLGARGAGAGLFLSDEVADAVGWRDGEALSLAERGPVPVAGRFAYPDDGRVAGLGYAILGDAPASSGLFDECWVTVWPQTPIVESLSGLVVVSGGAGAAAAPTLVQANATLGARFSADAERVIWSGAGLAAALLIGVAVAFHVRGRRLELASARHVGVRPADQYAITVIEVAVIAGIALILVLPFAAYAIFSEPSIAVPLLWHAVQSAILALAGAICGVMVGLAGVRERHLFRYFRER